MKLKVLDLFSGIGGISFGLSMTGGFQTVGYCEFDKWLQKRLANWHPGVPIYGDVRNFEHTGSVDVVCGGDPCQPHSNAGRRKGKEDDRYLWPAMLATVKKFGPSWVIRENVRGNISNGILDTVESDLEGAGYSCRTFLLPAYAVGAWHERFRTWTVAYSESARERREIGNLSEAHGGQGGSLLQQPYGTSTSDAMADSGCILDESERKRGNGLSQAGEVQGEVGQQRVWPAITNGGQALANPSSTGLQTRYEVGDSGQKGERKQQGCEPIRVYPEGRAQQWPVEPAVGRVANGIPDRIHRLKALGNAVVPQIPYAIGLSILQAEAA